MGSRYGGLKQIDPVGPSGEAILDFSVHDAVRAGFAKVVFVIRREIEKDFRRFIGSKFEAHVEVQYVFQELDKPCPGIPIPPDRKKPWGTGHAILMGADAIREPFAAINADDFYGAQSFRVLGDFLKSASDPDGVASPSLYTMVGFELRRTLSENGTVSRGVCRIGEDGLLDRVDEHTKIAPEGDDAVFTDEDGQRHPLPGDTTVSMNMWGFTPSIFRHLEQGFEAFLRERGQEPKSEFYIPSVVSSLIAEGKARVEVLKSIGQWYGVTYQEDRPVVAERIRAMVDQGDYASPLFTP